MKTVTLEVTQKDIDLSRKRLKGGSTNRSYNCPIALAGKRHFHNKIEVGYFKLYIFKKGKESKYRIDTAGFNFIKQYDEGKPVSPLTVVLTKIND